MKGAARAIFAPAKLVGSVAGEDTALPAQEELPRAAARVRPDQPRRDVEVGVRLQHVLPRFAEQILPLAFLHGYHVAFFWGAALFACALIASIVLINAHKEDIPAEPAALGEPVD